jgi:hypothetical protein
MARESVEEFLKKGGKVKKIATPTAEEVVETVRKKTESGSADWRKIHKAKSEARQERVSAERSRVRAKSKGQTARRREVFEKTRALEKKGIKTSLRAQMDETLNVPETKHEAAKTKIKAYIKRIQPEQRSKDAERMRKARARKKPVSASEKKLGYDQYRKKLDKQVEYNREYKRRPEIAEKERARAKSPRFKMAQKKYKQSSVGRQVNTEANKAYRQTEAYKQKQAALRKDPEWRAKRREQQRARRAKLKAPKLKGLGAVGAASSAISTVSSARKASKEGGSWGTRFLKFAEEASGLPAGTLRRPMTAKEKKRAGTL